MTKQVGKEAKRHPLFICRDILNVPSLAKNYQLADAHTLRTVLEIELAKYYSSLERTRNNVLVCTAPCAGVSGYVCVLIKCFSSLELSQVRAFELEAREILKGFESIADPKKSYYQNFERIIIAKRMPSSCKSLLFRYHIDGLQHKNAWEIIYTGVQKK